VLGRLLERTGTTEDEDEAEQEDEAFGPFSNML
jgi:hypothetical protein